MPYRAILESVFLLVATCSTIVGLTPKKDATWAKVLRIISGVVHPDEPGTLKLPFTNSVVFGVPAPKADLASNVKPEAPQK